MLVAAFLATAIAGPLIGVRQLDAASGEQFRLANARSDLDSLLRMQLAEETSLRGYLSTGDQTYLDDNKPPNPLFGQQAQDLEARLREAGIPGGIPAVEDMLDRHRTWEREVAVPLLRDPKSPKAYGQQQQRKVHHRPDERSTPRSCGKC